MGGLAVRDTIKGLNAVVCDGYCAAHVGDLLRQHFLVDRIVLDEQDPLVMTGARRVICLHLCWRADRVTFARFS